MTVSGNATEALSGKRTAQFVVERRDGWRVWTVLAFGVLAAAFYLAVAGVPGANLELPFLRGVICPGCGGTRALRFAALGQWGESLRYNPVSLILFLASAAMAVRAAVAGFSGRWYRLQIAWTPRPARILIAVIVVLIVALEIRQLSIASLLRPGLE